MMFTKCSLCGKTIWSNFKDKTLPEKSLFEICHKCYGNIPEENKPKYVMCNPINFKEMRMHPEKYLTPEQIAECENVAKGILEAPIKTTAEVLRRDYPLIDIKNWKEGTILLPLCPLMPNHCYLRLNDKRTSYCKIVEDEKNHPKRIVIVILKNLPFGIEDNGMDISKVNPVVSGVLTMASILVSVELGTTSMPVKEVMGIGEGTTIELDKLAGEPLDVKANGVLIAKGEAMIVDENFSVRITETIGVPNSWAAEETKSTETQEEGS